jgi:CDP-diglyceride synthetase
MLDFVKGLFAFNEIIMHLSFSFFIWVMTLTNLCILNHPYISEVKPTWLWWMILLMFWIWFASTSSRIFASMFKREIEL